VLLSSELDTPQNALSPTGDHTSSAGNCCSASQARSSGVAFRDRQPCGMLSRVEDETVATDIRSRSEQFARVEADPRSPLSAEWALRQPVAPIEVGASAGLCLHPDRWRYDFGHGRTVGDPGAPLLSTRANAATPVPNAVPEVVWRAGIDLDPRDVSDEDDLRWLETLPVGNGEEDAGRRERLPAAADIARSDPARIDRGDLLTETARLLEEASRSAESVVVFHSAVLAYLPEDARTEFADLMASPPATWIANEGLGIVTGTKRIPDAPPEAFAITVDGSPVALADPHGSWLTWLER
jgi:hypothetical protein